LPPAQQIEAEPASLPDANPSVLAFLWIEVGYSNQCLSRVVDAEFLYPGFASGKFFRNAARLFIAGVVRLMPVSANRVPSGSLAVPGQQIHGRRKYLGVDRTWLLGSL